MSGLSRLLVCIGFSLISICANLGCGNSQAEPQPATPQEDRPAADGEAGETQTKPKADRETQTEPKADASEAEASLKKDLKDAIGLLEKGEVASFIENYMPLEHVNHIRKFTTVEKIAESIKSGGLFEKAWIEKLQAMEKGKVVFLDEEKSRAVFEIDLAGKKEPPMDGLVRNPDREKIPETPGYQGDVKAAISAAIKTLEAGEYKTFIENMFPPAELYVTQDDDGMKLLLARLKDHPEMAKQMLADLKDLEKLTPELNAEKTKATFELNGRSVVFEKAGTWRFANTAKEIRTEMYKQSRQSPTGVSRLKRIEWVRIRDHWRLTQAE